ncbi:MAG: DegT/DnrJ/EryC1/StrS family aminotransferase [Eubacterium sp.]|nr:DegT/DnrJ/EryC1/StrS family aminotransferase [Eubacterium sp.]
MRQIPVAKPYFTEDEYKGVERALRSGWVAQGPEVAKFEQAVARHERVGYGVAVSSCTAALHLALVAEGVKEGMDVIVPAFTFVATANAVIQAGAVPVLADISQETYNIDVDRLYGLVRQGYVQQGGRMVNRVSGNVLWGIVPVHQFGLCCEVMRINALAKEYGVKVVEDAACALGSKIGGTHPGGFGNTACVSFHPRKSITTGEGGMVLTGCEEAAVRMRELRSHGCKAPSDERHKAEGFLLPAYHEAGYNYRMTDIQAAVGNAQVEKLDSILEKKRRKAAAYGALLKESLPWLKPPSAPEGYFHTYQSYVCMLDLAQLGIPSVEEGGRYRNALLERLEKAGVATRQGTHAVHLLDYYKKRFGYAPQDYPNAYACDRLSVALPLYAQMEEGEQEHVVGLIRKISASGM